MPHLNRSVAALLLIAVMLIAGCSTRPTGGQSDAEALGQARSIEGVAEAVISVGGSYNGFRREARTLVTVEIAPAFTVAKLRELADYLVRLGWSVNVEEPNTELAFGIEGTPNSDLAAALRDAGWEAPHDPAGSFVYITPEVVRAKLGPWPGPVPDVPEGMIIADAKTGP